MASNNRVHVKKGECACGYVGGLYRQIGGTTVKCRACWEGTSERAQAEAKERRLKRLGQFEMAASGGKMSPGVQAAVALAMLMGGADTIREWPGGMSGTGK